MRTREESQSDAGGDWVHWKPDRTHLRTVDAEVWLVVMPCGRLLRAGLLDPEHVHQEARRRRLHHSASDLRRRRIDNEVLKLPDALCRTVVRHETPRQSPILPPRIRQPEP